MIASLYLTQIQRCILIYLFLGLIICDLLNGFFLDAGLISEGGLASPSQLGRLCALLFIVTAFYIYRWPVSILCVGLYFILIEISSGLIFPNINGFKYGLIVSYKIIYLILLLAFFNCIVRYDNAQLLVTQLLKANVLLIISAIFFSYFTGYGMSTYSFGPGTKSYFASGNGLGVYLGAAGLILRAVHFRVFGKQLNKLYIVLSVLALLFVGTKTSAIFAIVLFLGFFKGFKSFFVIGLMFLFTTVVFGSLLGDELLKAFEVVALRYQNSESLIAFFASGRDDYTNDAVKTFLTQDISALRFLFGGGAVLSFQDPYGYVIYDTLETDPFDVFFSYGFIGFLLYLFFAFYVLLKSKRAGLLMPALLLTGHSLVAGHVLFNGMSVFLWAVCYFYVNVIPLKLRV